MSHASRVPKLLTTIVVVVGSASLLSGCVTGYAGRISDGQEKVDAAIATADLGEEVDAEYTCGGALPFTATDCGVRVTVITDDLGVLEHAADVDLLRAEGSWTLVYRDVRYLGELDDLLEVEPIADALPSNVTIDQVSVTADGVMVQMRDVDDFESLCGITRTMGLSGTVISRIDAGMDLEIDLAMVDDEHFDDACRFADEAVADLGVGGLTRVDVGSDQSGPPGPDIPQPGMRVTIIPDSKESFDSATEWAESVAVPAGVDLSVPIHY